MEDRIFFFQLLPAVITAVVISLVAMPAIIQVAQLKELIDKPDGERKMHEGIVPNLGGIGIFAAFLIAFSIWGNAASLSAYPFFVASLFMIFLIGIKDDIIIIAPVKKLGVQALAVLEIVIGGKVYLTDLGGLFYINQISPTVGMVLTFFIFMILINSYNLIDGVNGLAGGVGVLISTTVGTWFFISGFYSMAILAFALVGSLVGFLVYNLKPAKIFMGDTGAMAVGFILLFIVFQFITLNQAHPNSAYYVTNGTVVALAIFIIPIVDTTRIIILRLAEGKSPLEADYNHLHHKCLKNGMTHIETSIYLWMCNLTVILTVMIFNYLNVNVLAVLILGVGYGITTLSTSAYSFVRHKYLNKDFISSK